MLKNDSFILIYNSNVSKLKWTFIPQAFRLVNWFGARFQTRFILCVCVFNSIFICLELAGTFVLINIGSGRLLDCVIIMADWIQTIIIKSILVL